MTAITPFRATLHVFRYLLTIYHPKGNNTVTLATYDTIIVGHGIAGALLGYFLEQAGQRCCYFDASEQTAATQVAAGIINPITGRRYVKAWRVGELLPFARQTYRHLEAMLGISIYHERALVRSLFSHGEDNDWQARQLDTDYADYFQHPPQVGNIPAITHPVFGYFQPAQSAQVNIGTLVDALRNRRVQAGCFRDEVFDYAQLEVLPTGVRYGALHAERIVFCEGWRNRNNPFFDAAPFQGNKGQVFLIRLPEARLDAMFKHRLFVVPFEEDLYWVGSTSENQFADDAPSAKGADYLHARLAEVLTTPYEVVAHRAAVRPTVKDRRPVLGQHPVHAPLWMFNGLGTKGASLAPYWAQHLTQHILSGTPIDDEVHSGRFLK